MSHSQSTGSKVALLLLGIALPIGLFAFWRSSQQQDGFEYDEYSESHSDDPVDSALEDTFPASDPSSSY